MPRPDSVQVDLLGILHQLKDQGPCLLRKALEDGIQVWLVQLHRREQRTLMVWVQGPQKFLEGEIQVESVPFLWR